MARIRLTTQIKKNLDFYLNDILLDAGMYENVAVGELNFDNDDMSELLPVDVDGVTVSAGTTEYWQSRTRNWVYESGIVVPSGYDEPTVASGVYISNVYKERSDATYGHYIDYKKGRVVFDTAQDVSASIQNQFSYKTVMVKFPEDDYEVLLGRIYGLNPDIETTFNIPNQTMQELPLLLIEWADHNLKGLQLGGGRIADSRVLLHVFSSRQDSYIKDDIIDIILEKEGGVPWMVDWGVATDPIDYNGDFASGQYPFSYKDMQADDNLLFHRLYFDSIIPNNVPNSFGIDQAMIDINLKTWLPEF